MAENTELMDASGDREKMAKAKTALAQDPLALAALEASHTKESHTFLLTLPPNVRRRVNALKNLQAKSVYIEAEFYRKVHALEIEYAQKHLEFNEKRKRIVNGEYEPNDEESDFKSSAVDELPDELKEKLSVANGPDNGEKGISDFWLTLFKNTDIIGEMIQEHDEPILKHLKDVEVKITNEPMGFELHFHFSPNVFFTNTVLTKKYLMKCEPDPEDVLEFDGPEIVSCKGTEIHWNADKNVTVKKIKKKQKHKSKGATRFVTREVKTDSFFNFFDPPPAESEDLDDETKELLNVDFEIGQTIRDRIVPRAVLYYTGEAHDEEDEFDDEDEDEMSDEIDEEDDDDEDDHE